MPIREVAEILVRGLDRLFKSRESQPDARRYALSLTDPPCSVSFMLVNGFRNPKS
jgi:hypothetical protein